MRYQTLLLCAGLAVGAGPGAFAQQDTDGAAGADRIEIGAHEPGAEDELDREPLDCLPLNRIRSTDVVDDSTIIFYGPRNQPYVNILPRRCPGLTSNDRFSYELRRNRLCETDWITVLERFGTGFDRGFTCRLGVFHPSNEEAVAILKGAAESGRGAPSSTVTPVELPEPEAESEDADSERAAQ